MRELRPSEYLHCSGVLMSSFLDLMASTPASLFVPTLDIDLAWHSHQLMARKYSADCFRTVGRFVDQ